MELKAARKELNAKPKAVSLDKIEKEVEKEGDKIFYFDRENSHKDLMEMVEHFEEKGYSVYFREIRYGLDENDYLYEVHILV
ncbi:HP0268 family nuclease [Hydrogenimonas sp. SS33]|uniref:HP0268 family nuclease n=1 Tax=Hydrogenimonas leucolamina TaxID=2954236 RepID=UPI00336BBC40